MTYAVGCDVSRYNVSFDPSKATGQIDFAIQKATEGTGYIDLEYEAIWQGVKQAAVRGSYHYLRSGMSWLAQADHFLRTAERHSYHIHALDLEEVSNTYDDRFFADAKRVIDRWRAVSNKLAILYTNGSTFNQMVIALRRLYGSAGVLWMLEVPLWIASPGIAGAPILPKYRTNGDWLIHQYSWTGMPSRWGTGGTRVDENVWNGSVNTMRAYLRLPPVEETQPQPEPGEIMQGKVLVNLNIRPTPGVSLPAIGQLAPGDIVESIGTPLAGWWKLSKWTRGGVVKPLPSNDCFAYEGQTQGYIQTIDAPQQPPASDVRPVSGTIELVMSDGTKQTYSIGQFTRVG